MTTEIDKVTSADEPRPSSTKKISITRKFGPTDGRSSEGGVLHVFSHGMLVVWALMVGVPLLWVLWSSFKTSNGILTDPWGLPTSFHFENWANAWNKANRLTGSPSMVVIGSVRFDIPSNSVKLPTNPP